MGTPDSIGSRIVLFDGVCNLCNHSVQFIIKRDSKSLFSFASLQSQFGQSQLSRFNIPIGLMESIVLIKNGRCYHRSDAVLEIARDLGGLWPLFYGFKIIPRFIRDLVYNLIAKNRYKVFGRQDHCMIPTPALKARFLD